MCVRKHGKIAHCSLQDEVIPELYKLSRVVRTKKTYIKECLMTLYGELGKKTWMGEGMPEALMNEICQFWLGWFDGCPGEGDISAKILDIKMNVGVDFLYNCEVGECAILDYPGFKTPCGSVEIATKLMT